MESYLEKDYAKMSRKPSVSSIILQWLPPTTSTEFRETMEKLLSAIQHFNSKKLVSDTTCMGIVREEGRAMGRYRMDNQSYKSRMYTFCDHFT